VVAELDGLEDLLVAREPADGRRGEVIVSAAKNPLSFFV
jgi:hypothetical protein